jgi:PAS domain S-box-containing protein
VKGALKGFLEDFPMAIKPSYEELEQRVKELDKVTAMRKQADDALRESEERYRLAVERSSDGVAVIMGETLSYVNEKFAQIFGYDRPEEVVGKPVSLFVQPDDHEPASHSNDSKQPGRPAPSQYECKGIRKDGSPIYLSASSGSTSYDGKPASMLFLRDVTQQKLDEKDLHESEAKYRNIFENIQDIYYEASLDGIILEVSPSIEKVSQYRREQVIGTSLYDMYVYPAERDEVVKQLLKKGKVNDYEVFLKDANGAKAYCSITTALVRDKHNNPQKIIGSLRNITERIRMESALRESEAQKIAILEASIDRIRYVDKDMNVLWANKAAASGLEMSAEGLKGRRCYEVFISRNTPCEGCPTAKAIETGQLQRAVMHHTKIKGIEGESYWDTYCVPIKNNAGEVVSYLQVSRNVTEQKQTTDALHEKEETLRAILAASPVGVGLARDRMISWANRAMYELLGYNEKEEDSLKGHTTRLFYPDDEEYDRMGQELYSAVKDTGIGRVDTKWIKKDGRVLDCYVQATLLDPSDPEKGVIVAALDITKRKEAEEKIHRLTHELIRVQENERQRISRELHDRVAQDLSTAKIVADQILRSQTEAALPEVRREISKISSALQGVINTVRNLAYDLRPPVLDDMGLVQAIFQYCEEFSERTGLGIEFSSAGLETMDLDSDTEINLYRLIQEGLNNIKKHAEARRVTVKLVRAFPNIILRIEDDGKGFDVNARRIASPQEKRMGLQSMEERVHLLQGKMEIQSHPMQGTKIIIRIPSKETKRDPQENRDDC